MLSMNEYVIERSNKYLVIAPNGPKDYDIQWTENLRFASVFKSKSRALALANGHSGEVQLYYGAPVPQGTKRIVAPKQSQVNRTSPYRSI